jgi:hypothetical protein
MNPYQNQTKDTSKYYVDESAQAESNNTCGQVVMITSENPDRQSRYTFHYYLVIVWRR